MLDSLDFEKMQRIKDFVFVSQNWMVDKPNEILGGVIRYNNHNYYFKYNHEFGEGNTYVVFDSNGTPLFYFFLYLDEATDKFNSLTEN